MGSRDCDGVGEDGPIDELPVPADSHDDFTNPPAVPAVHDGEEDVATTSKERARAIMALQQK